MPVNAVRRELVQLEKAGFLISEEADRVKYFWVNKKNPIYEELKSIILKTQAIGDSLRKLVNKIPDIKTAFIYGSVAKGDERETSDIDLMVIGSIDSVKLHKEINRIEDKLHRAISYILITEGDLKKKKTDFIKRILKEEKIFLIGNEEELRKLT